MGLFSYFVMPTAVQQVVHLSSHCRINVNNTISVPLDLHLVINLAWVWQPLPGARCQTSVCMLSLDFFLV